LNEDITTDIQIASIQHAYIQGADIQEASIQNNQATYKQFAAIRGTF
jgi:hypothetical protein